MHLTSSPVDWYAARAGGIVAYVLLTAVVVFGITMAGRPRLQRWPRIALEDVHRFGGLLAGTFIAIHVVTIAIDSYLPFSLTSIVVPFVSSYRPAWVGLGIVAAELLVALAVTNRLRQRSISYGAWRRAHYLNFAVWGAASIHGLGSGTDRGTAWFMAIEAVSVALVLTLLGWRIARTRRLAPPARIAGAPAALAGVAAVALLAHGPWHPHHRPWNAAAFTDTLNGTVSRQTGATRGIVSLAGNGSGNQHVLVRADLLLEPGRVKATSFQMEYLPSGTPCRGHVTRVDQDGLGFSASCRMPDGARRSIVARWQDGQGPDLQGGTLTSSAGSPVRAST